jgi:hypothetical protein
MKESDFIKASNVFAHVETMKPLIRACDWDGLEQQSELRCREHAGDTDTRRISRISLRLYQEALTGALSLAVGKAHLLGAKAIYLEFDMDYDWRSWLFICPVYPKHWDRLLGTDYMEEIDGPEMPRFANIYGKLQFIGLARDACMISYLIARTFACFGRVSQQFAGAEVALGIAFHDQDEIIRLYENTEQA